MPQAAQKLTTSRHIVPSAFAATQVAHQNLDPESPVDEPPATKRHVAL